MQDGRTLHATPEPPGSRPAEPPPRWARSPMEEKAGPAPALETALAWVGENQSLAMLGAFAVGVFIGVMMRR